MNDLWPNANGCLHAHGDSSFLQPMDTIGPDIICLSSLFGLGTLYIGGKVRSFTQQDCTSQKKGKGKSAAEVEKGRKWNTCFVHRRGIKKQKWLPPELMKNKGLDSALLGWILLRNRPSVSRRCMDEMLGLACSP